VDFGPGSDEKAGPAGVFAVTENPHAVSRLTSARGPGRRSSGLQQTGLGSMDHAQRSQVLCFQFFGTPEPCLKKSPGTGAEPLSAAVTDRPQAAEPLSAREVQLGGVLEDQRQWKSTAARSGIASVWFLNGFRCHSIIAQKPVGHLGIAPIVAGFG